MAAKYSIAPSYPLYLHPDENPAIIVIQPHLTEKNLHERLSTGDFFRVLDLQEVWGIRQGFSSVTEYFTRLKILWEELVMLRPIPQCDCSPTQAFKDYVEAVYIISFLRGLNESFEPLTSKIFSKIFLAHPLPKINEVYNLAIKFERQLRTSAVLHNVAFLHNVASDSHGHFVRPLPPNRYMITSQTQNTTGSTTEQYAEMMQLFRRMKCTQTTGHAQHLASCTAIMAFCTPQFGLIAVDSWVINSLTGMGRNGFDKLIFILSTILLAGTGRRSVFDEVKAELPIQLGDRDLDYESLDQAIQDIVMTINNILIYRHPVAERRDYSEDVDAFVLLLLVNGEFGVVLISINADYTEFVAERPNERFLNEGCGAWALQDYQRRHQINLDITNVSALKEYAIDCMISAVERNPGSCGGEIQLMVIKKRDRVTTYTLCHGYEGGRDPIFEEDTYEHE